MTKSNALVARIDLWLDSGEGPCRVPVGAVAISTEGSPRRHLQDPLTVEYAICWAVPAIGKQEADKLSDWDHPEHEQIRILLSGIRDVAGFRAMAGKRWGNWEIGEPQAGFVLSGVNEVSIYGVAKQLVPDLDATWFTLESQDPKVE